MTWIPFLLSIGRSAAAGAVTIALESLDQGARDVGGSGLRPSQWSALQAIAAEWERALPGYQNGIALGGVTVYRGHDLMSGETGPDPTRIFLSTTTLRSFEDLGFAVVPEPAPPTLAAIPLCAWLHCRRRTSSQLSREIPQVTGIPASSHRSPTPMATQFHISSASSLIPAVFRLLAVVPLLAAVVSADDWNFNARLSYYNHTGSDAGDLNAEVALLNSNEGTDYTGAVSAPSSMYLKINGNNDYTGTNVQAGDYLLIRPAGRIRVNGGDLIYPQAVSGVFTDGTKIRDWNGNGNRFLQVSGSSSNPAKVLPVAGVPVSLNLADPVGSLTNAHDAAAGSFGGTAAQDILADFNAGSSQGPGVIVRVPSATNVYLFPSVNASAGFSNITDTDLRLYISEVDPVSGRSRFYIDPKNRSIREGESRGITISREFALGLPAKVKYTITLSGQNGGTDPTDFSTTGITGTLRFDPGDPDQETAQIGVIDDGIYEGAENFTVKLEVLQNDNPNESYVEGNGTTVYTYPITVPEGGNQPVFTIKPGNYTTPEGAGVIGGLSSANAFVDIQMDRPSKFDTSVDVAVSSTGTTATLNDDFNWISAPEYGQAVVITGNKGLTTVRKYFKVNPDNIYEGDEDIRFYLNAAQGATVAPNSISTFKITNTTLAPVVTFAVLNTAHQNSKEDENQLRVVGVTLDKRSATPTVIPLAFSGTAAFGVDYSVTGAVGATYAPQVGASPSTLTIPALTTSADLQLTVTDDSLLEFDEVITVGAAPPYVGFSPGSPLSASMIVGDDDGRDGDAAQIVPDPEPPLPTGNAAIAMRIDNSLADIPVAVWRIRGEPLWRMPDDPATASTLEGVATGLVPGHHEIEFRSFDGWISPPPMIVQVLANQTWTPAAGAMPGYIRTNSSPPGTSLTVNLIISGTAATPGWKLEGEAAWRASGITMAGFPRGIYRIFFKPVSGYALPPETVLSFSSSPSKTISKTYVGYSISNPAPAWNPVNALPDSAINTPSESAVFVGRITSSAGSGTGCVAHLNTVLTCAHVLFDDASLSFATNVRWHHQAQKGFHQPAAAASSEYTGVMNTITGKPMNISTMVARGWLVMGGYAAKRQEYLQANGNVGFSNPDSQNLDVGVAYFGKSPTGNDPTSISAARGYKTGVLLRGPAEAPGRWLQAGTTESPVDKRLIGYPYENVDHDQLGKVFSTTYSQANGNYSLFTVVHAQDNVFNSHNIVAGGGMSGAPVMIQTSPGVWKVCAIYLGGNAGSNYGVMRELDAAIGNMITNAQGLTGGDGNTTGGGKSFSSTLEDDGLNPGRVSFRANVGGAGWRPLGRQSYKACASPQREGDPLDVPSGETVPVEFSKVDGWKEPTVMLIEADPQGEGEVPVVYTALTYQSIRSQLATAGASVAKQAPTADFDGDGIANCLEWAFNLDPAARDAVTLVPTTGTAGMPQVRMVGQGSSRRLRVEFVRMKSTGLHYEAQFASGLAAGDWSAAAGTVIAVSDIDANWQRVVVEDSQEGQPKRFARVKVVEN